jgi:hypothetical protein
MRNIRVVAHLRRGKKVKAHTRGLGGGPNKSMQYVKNLFDRKGTTKKCTDAPPNPTADTVGPGGGGATYKTMDIVDQTYNSKGLRNKD